MDHTILAEQQSKNVKFEEPSSYSATDDKGFKKPAWKRIRCIESDSDSDDKENEDTKKKRKSLGTKVSRDRDQYGKTPLHTACENGNLEKVEELVEKGYSLHQRDSAGWYPLHETSSPAVAEYLISQGARVDVRNYKKYGWVTPLMDAAECGQVYMMQLLIEKGADISLKDIEGRTALDILTAWRDKKYISDNAWLTVYNEVVDLLNGKKAGEEVFLLIPSMLGDINGALEAVYRELGINREQCVVWPGVDKISSVTDAYLPHIMLDIVNFVRNSDVDSFSEMILSTGKMDTYEYLKFHGAQTDNALQEVFKRIEEIIGDINSKHQSLGRLLSGKSKKMKILAIKFTAMQPAYKDVVAQLINPVFEWTSATSLRGTASKTEKVEEEYEALWKWLKSRIRTNFEIVICPERNATMPEHEMLWSKKFASKIMEQLTSKLLNLKQLSPPSAATCTIVWTIDGANRDVLKYKAFVRKIIERGESKPEEMFFIVSIEENDEIATIRDVVPSQLVRNARVYSAFNPENARITCFVIHIKQKDIDVMGKQR